MGTGSKAPPCSTPPWKRPRQATSCDEQHGGEEQHAGAADEPPEASGPGRDEGVEVLLHRPALEHGAR